MRKLHYLLSALVLLLSITAFGQEKLERTKITITGKIIEKTSKLPLEYATITLKIVKTQSLFLVELPITKVIIL